MASYEKILDIARAELGTKENPPGSNRQKYGKYFKNDGQPWCMWNVSWVFVQAGAPELLLGTPTGYTVTIYQRAVAAGRFGKTPRKGAVVLFNFGDKNYGGRPLGIHHVGFVESIRPDGKLITIEGNTSSGSNANGGQVQRRVRDQSQVAGYYYPAYDEVIKAETSNVEVDTQYPTLQIGSKNSNYVKKLQNELNSIGYKLVVDGDFGKNTKNAIIDFQGKNSLVQDGVVGPLTWSKLMNKKTIVSNHCHNINSAPLLRKGTKGDWVKHLQADLNRVGKFRLKIDGDFGDKTTKAVKTFQTRNGLDNDGIVGPKTWSRLL